jgi:hypothetical protein
MQDAAQRQDTESVARLVEEQERTARQINDTSTWLAQQVGTLGDAESLTKVGGGLATGGLIGGLQSFTQALAGQKAQESRDALMVEATRRMEELYNSFGSRSAVATGMEWLDFTKNTIVFLAGRAYTVPLEVPPAETAPSPDPSEPGAEHASPAAPPDTQTGTGLQGA